MIAETQDILKAYAQEVTNLYKTGVTTEHSFRGSLQTLLNSLLPQYSAVNEPQRSACGAPDYALVGKKDRQAHAYIEAKDLFDNDLRGVNTKGHKEQFDRYRQALSRVAFTDYLDFRFVVDGTETAAVSLLRPNAKGGFDIADGERFVSILTHWADCSIQPINSTRRLAEVMAYKARLLRESIEKALENDETSDIHGQFEAFRNVLLHDLTPAGFADLYAQTIVYGMFAARLNDPTPEDFSRQEAATLIPFSNPFLRKIFQQIAVFDLDSRIAWIVDDLVEAFAVTDVGKIMGRYRQNSLHQDPLIHFYEDFLAAYDPRLRKACGVYYTPQPVVSFIVRAIDEVLVRDFGLPDGLADDSKVGGAVSNRPKGKTAVASRNSPTSYLYPHRVQILDPATGTGTFLAEAVRQIYRRFEGNEGLWPQYVEESLRPRLHGFELLMAPYTITHLKLDMMIGQGAVASLSNPQGSATSLSRLESNDFARQGCRTSLSRLRVYLTNSLEECHPDTGTLFAQWLSNESAEANAIKRDCPVMVMMGNPPYSISSSNKGEWILHLLKDYKKDLNEKKTNLDDDYIKFIRLGQHYIERNGSGVMGFITNNSYLDGMTHRQMRKTLLETFDDIYIANLHGNSKRKETAPDGSKDENVFDITVGTSIAIFVKTGGAVGNRTTLATLHYIDIYGTRKAKYDALDSCSLASTAWQQLECKAPYYFFVPKDFGLQEEYETGVKISELFMEYNSGIQTKRDSVNVFFDDEERLNVLNDFKELSEHELREKYVLKADGRDWQVLSAKDDLKYNEVLATRYMYRPFDARFTNYTGKTKGIMGYPRHKTMCHMIKENVSLVIPNKVTSFPDYHHAFVYDGISDLNSVSIQTGEQSFVFPLYLYDETGERHLNMRIELIGDRKPEDFFAYIYAVLHSPSYRERYREFLKIDFPRIPLPTRRCGIPAAPGTMQVDETQYRRLVALGRQLIDLHLMRGAVKNRTPKYPVPGTNTVEAARFVPNCARQGCRSSLDGRVYINDTQYFDGVSETAWTFFIGGYQPAQKWLKDRKGRKLSLDDIRHYQRIIATLDTTAEIMAEIG